MGGAADRVRTTTKKMVSRSAVAAAPTLASTAAGATGSVVRSACSAAMESVVAPSAASSPAMRTAAEPWAHPFDSVLTSSAVGSSARPRDEDRMRPAVASRTWVAAESCAVRDAALRSQPTRRGPPRRAMEPRRRVDRWDRPCRPSSRRSCPRGPFARPSQAAAAEPFAASFGRERRDPTTPSQTTPSSRCSASRPSNRTRGRRSAPWFRHSVPARASESVASGRTVQAHARWRARASFARCRSLRPPRFAPARSMPVVSRLASALRSRGPMTRAFATLRSRECLGPNRGSARRPATRPTNRTPDQRFGF